MSYSNFVWSLGGVAATTTRWHYKCDKILAHTVGDSTLRFT